jgi:hypothetical protein
MLLLDLTLFIPGCRETLERLKSRRRNPKHDALYLIKSTYENGVVMYNAQQHNVTSSTWMVRRSHSPPNSQRLADHTVPVACHPVQVYGPYDTPIGFAERKATE